jgi:ribose transport system substrate-binding protein
MKSGFGFVGALSLAFAAVACGASDADEPSTNTKDDDKESAEEERNNINRDEIEESSFKPVELENTVDKLVSAIEAKPAEAMKLKVVLKELTGYWEPVQLGAKRALGELDVTGGVEAPIQEGEDAKEDVAVQRQIEIMEKDVKAGYNGFALAPFGDDLAEQIAAVNADKIPVVTIDSDVAESKRALYIGTMNADAGETGGTSLADLLKDSDVDSGSVVIYGHDDEGWQDGFDRTMGAKKVLEEAGFTAIVHKVDWSDTGEATDLALMADDFANADPPVVGMLGVFSVAYRCAMAAQAAEKEAGDIKIAAFDFDPKTVEFMQDGYIQVTHAQRQYYMGYLAPYVLYGINVLGADKTKDILSAHMVDNVRFNAGLDVVGADQLDDYYTYLDSLGIGGI